MMANNAGLHSAKDAKNDEFYTQYSDIEAEINAYYEFNPDVFKDKTILLPCDDPEWSNFTKYFASNFERFGIKKLISTSYAKKRACSDNANKTRIYKMNEMDTDHAAAWSRGGATDIANCEILCITHNRAKGNK